MSTTPTLRGAGIVLRPLELADAPALFIALGDAEVQRFRAQPTHEGVEDTRRYIRDTLQRSCAAWAITMDGGEALGRLALRVPESIGEFGIVIRRAAQGCGLGAKSITLAEAFAFQSLALAELRANIDAENAASLGLFTRLGYTQVALRRADRTTKLGVRDTVVVAKQRPS